jgi:hypothetical protein
MRFRLTQAWFGIAAALVLAAFAAHAPTAHAFTFENKDADGAYAVPKFDIEEQAKNFRKGADSSNGKTSYDTPIGKLQFGVGQGGVSNFGTFGGSGFGPTPRNTRADFERMVTPEGLR